MTISRRTEPTHTPVVVVVTLPADPQLPASCPYAPVAAEAHVLLPFASPLTGPPPHALLDVSHPPPPPAPPSRPLGPCCFPLRCACAPTPPALPCCPCTVAVGWARPPLLLLLCDGPLLLAVCAVADARPLSPPPPLPRARVRAGEEPRPSESGAVDAELELLGPERGGGRRPPLPRPRGARDECGSASAGGGYGVDKSRAAH